METYGGSIATNRPRRRQARAGCALHPAHSGGGQEVEGAGGDVRASDLRGPEAGPFVALLLRGPSGAGKSDLALRLIEAGGALVADD